MDGSLDWVTCAHVSKRTRGLWYKHTPVKEPVIEQAAHQELPGQRRRRRQRLEQRLGRAKVEKGGPRDIVQRERLHGQLGNQVGHDRFANQLWRRGSRNR